MHISKLALHVTFSIAAVKVHFNALYTSYINALCRDKWTDSHRNFLCIGIVGFIDILAIFTGMNLKGTPTQGGFISKFKLWLWKKNCISGIIHFAHLVNIRNFKAYMYTLVWFNFHMKGVHSFFLHHKVFVKYMYSIWKRVEFV